MDAKAIATPVSPIITAILAGLGFWLREVWKRRNRTAAYARALEQAQKQTLFVDGWLRAHQQIASPDEHEAAKRRLMEELNHAYVLVGNSRAAVQRYNEPITIRKVLNSLFLLKHPHSDRTRALIIVYYFALAFAALCVCGLAAFAGFGVTTPSSTSAPDSSSDTQVSFPGSLFLGLCCVAVRTPIAILPAWLLHRLISWEDPPGNSIPNTAGTQAAIAPPCFRQAPPHIVEGSIPSNPPNERGSASPPSDNQ